MQLSSFAIHSSVPLLSVPCAPLAVLLVLAVVKVLRLSSGLLSFLSLLCVLFASLSCCVFLSFLPPSTHFECFFLLSVTRSSCVFPRVSHCLSVRPDVFVSLPSLSVLLLRFRFSACSFVSLSLCSVLSSVSFSPLCHLPTKKSVVRVSEEEEKRALESVADSFSEMDRRRGGRKQRAEAKRCTNRTKGRIMTIAMYEL